MEDCFVQQDARQAGEPHLFRLEAWEKLSPEVTAGFSGRQGGVSAAPWNGLNIGLHVGDDPAHVLANRRALCAALGWPAEAWTCAQQVHGSQIARVTREMRGKGLLALTDAIADCDALMTNETNVLLVAVYADCVPLYFWDEASGAVALAHAGWRGTVGQITVLTIEAMKAEYGAEPHSLRAAIGPAIGRCCYEVDAQVAVPIRALMSRHEQAEAPDCMMLTEQGNGKFYVDLKEINRQLMIKAGILPMHIEMSKWCTGCRTDQFFSHRKSGGTTGRMASWIGRK